MYLFNRFFNKIKKIKKTISDFLEMPAMYWTNFSIFQMKARGKCCVVRATPIKLLFKKNIPIMSNTVSSVVWFHISR